MHCPDSSANELSVLHERIAHPPRNNKKKTKAANRYKVRATKRVAYGGRGALAVALYPFRGFIFLVEPYRWSIFIAALTHAGHTRTYSFCVERIQFCLSETETIPYVCNGSDSVWLEHNRFRFFESKAYFLLTICIEKAPRDVDYFKAQCQMRIAVYSEHQGSCSFAAGKKKLS